MSIFYVHLIIISIIYIFPRSPSLPSNRSLVLPLKAQTFYPPKLSFRHNVTLTVSLSVGSPPQDVTMVLDTGSELPWLHCNTTAHRSAPSFNPRASFSYSAVPCSSNSCQKRTRDLPVPASCEQRNISSSCHVAVTYADASSVEGSLANETLRLGSLTRPGFMFGCMNTGFSSNGDEDSKTTGLMGMNRGSLSFVNQMGYTKFSYCIPSLGYPGVLLLGDADFSNLTKPLNYTPLVLETRPLPYFDRTAYTVDLVGIKVGVNALSLPSSVFVPDHTGAGQTMIDSGTQFTFLLGPVYTALKKEFVEQTKGLLKIYEDPNFVFQGAMDLCYQIDDHTRRLPELPPVSLMFRGTEMMIQGVDKLLYRVPGMANVSCFTFGSSDMLGIEAFVIGNHQQQNLWMEFDLVKSRLGFAETSCKVASQRLGSMR